MRGRNDERRCFRCAWGGDEQDGCVVQLGGLRRELWGLVLRALAQVAADSIWRPVRKVAAGLDQAVGGEPARGMERALGLGDDWET